MNVLPIAVLIPTMNRPQALRRTLQTYVSADAVPAEVVIVDQSPDPQTIVENRAIAEEFDGETAVRYLYQGLPSGAIARNLAMDHATQPIYVFSDDDVDVYSDTLENVYALMQDETVALIAGTDDNVPNAHQSALGYLTGVRSYRKRNIGHITDSLLGRFPLQVDEETPTEWAMGFFFAVRRELVEKWQICWDEHFTSYAYAEDLDFSMNYCKHATAEGLRCILSSRVHIAHLATKEYRIPSRKSTFMYVLNRAYLCQKYQLGKRCELAMAWTNACRLLERTIKRQQADDLRDAIKAARQNRALIACGDFAKLYE